MHRVLETPGGVWGAGRDPGTAGGKGNFIRLPKEEAVAVGDV